MLYEVITFAGTTTFLRMSFIDNHVPTQGGAITTNSSGAGIVLRDSLIAGNSAANGGGLAVPPSGAVTIRNNFV